MIRALVVDDDFMVAELHADFTVRVPGFQVVGIAHSGSEALAAIERQRPDLVILDIYLPDQSGLAVLQQLRRGGPDMDVIMVTAAKDMPSLQQAMQGGVLHYIVKRYRAALPRVSGATGPGHTGFALGLDRPSRTPLRARRRAESDAPRALVGAAGLAPTSQASGRPPPAGRPRSLDGPGDDPVVKLVQR